MSDKIFLPVKQYHDLLMEALSGPGTFMAYADVLIVLRPSVLEEARMQKSESPEEVGGLPFRQNVYNRASSNSVTFLSKKRGKT